MPGQPLRRAIHAELLRRAKDELGDDANALDYGEYWTASGRTMTALANTVAHKAGMTVSREMVRRAIYSDESEPGEAERRLRLARTRGAHAMVDDAKDIIDGSIVHRDHLAKSKLQADIRERIASKWNREEWGETKQPALTINVASLHLDSLRRQVQQTNNPLALPPATAQVVDAQVVNTDDTISLPGGSTD